MFKIMMENTMTKAPFTDHLSDTLANLYTRLQSREVVEDREL